VSVQVICMLQAMKDIQAMKKVLLIFLMMLLLVGMLGACARTPDLAETPTVETEAPIPEPDQEPAPSAESSYSIQVHWATEAFLSQFDFYHEFIEIDAENNRSAVSATREQFGLDLENTRRIAFTTDVPITHFSFVEANARLEEWTSDGNEWSVHDLSVDALYWQTEFTPETPVIITWDDWMRAPYRWISVLYYIDDGSEWGQFEEESFFIQRTGDDISLIHIADLDAVLSAEFADHERWWGRPPRTHVIGILEHPDLTVESLAIYMDSWILAHRHIRSDWSDVYEIQEAHEIILQEHADSIVDEGEWSTTIRKMLSPEDAAVVHDTLQNLEAIEELTPGHSGHPSHGDPIFQILISYTDGTYERIRTGEWGAFLFRLMGTFTSHGDEAFVGGVSEELYSLFLSYFIS